MLIFQEEVDAQVCFTDHSRVLNRKVTNTWEDEVLEGFHANNTGPRVDEQNVGALERGLARSPPEA
jgi:hypothetical protein